MLNLHFCNSSNYINSLKYTPAGAKQLADDVLSKQQSFYTPGGKTINSVDIKFYSGANCTESLVYATTLNGGENGVTPDAGTYTSSNASNNALCANYLSSYSGLTGCDGLLADLTGDPQKTASMQYTYNTVSGVIHSQCMYNTNNNPTGNGAFEGILDYTNPAEPVACVGSGGSSCGFSQNYLPTNLSYTPGWSQLGPDQGGVYPYAYPTTSISMVGESVYAINNNMMDMITSVLYFNGTTWSNVTPSYPTNAPVSWSNNNDKVSNFSAAGGGNLYINTNQYPSFNDPVYNYLNGSWVQTGSSGDLLSDQSPQPGEINSMTATDNSLFVGTGSQYGASNLYQFNGASWSTVGTSGATLNDAVVANYSNSLHMVGSIATSGENIYALAVVQPAPPTTQHIYQYSGGEWSELGNINTNLPGLAALNNGYDMAAFGDKVYIDWQQYNNCQVAMWYGFTWSQLGDLKQAVIDANVPSYVNGYLSGSLTCTFVYSVSTDNLGNVYAGLLNSDNSGDVWMWNGQSWSLLGGNQGDALSHKNYPSTTPSYLSTYVNNAVSLGANTFVSTYSGGVWVYQP